MLYLIGRCNKNYYVIDTDDYIIRKVKYEELRDMVYSGIDVSGMDESVVDELAVMGTHLTPCFGASVMRTTGQKSYIQLPIHQHDGFIYIERDNYAFHYDVKKSTVHVLVHGVYYSYTEKNGVWCISDGVDGIVRTQLMHSPYFIGYDIDTHQVLISGGSRNVFFNSDKAYTARDLEGRFRTSILNASRRIKLSEFKRLVLLGK